MDKDLDLFVESLDRTEGYMSLREKAGFWDFMINLLNNRSLPSVGAGGTSQQTKLGKKGKGAKNLINLLKQHPEFAEDFVKAKIIAPVDESSFSKLLNDAENVDFTKEGISKLLNGSFLTKEQIEKISPVGENSVKNPENKTDKTEADSEVTENKDLKDTNDKTDKKPATGGN